MKTEADKIIEEEARMATENDTPIKCKCNRCNWKWTSKPRPTSPRPTVCPHCHSYLWNRPKPKRTKKAGKRMRAK